jgi:hypothetical protein
VNVWPFRLLIAFERNKWDRGPERTAPDEGGRPNDAPERKLRFPWAGRRRNLKRCMK